MEKQFPSDGVELTTLLVVTDIERSRWFYRDVWGATIFREYGGTSCVLDFAQLYNTLYPDEPAFSMSSESNPAPEPHTGQGISLKWCLSEKSLPGRGSLQPQHRRRL
jgi:catechol 2,3-dioxygenase-like lactoylglutathione lyase family enzyme